MIIESLLDTDLYKITMMEVVAHRFPFVDVEYAFKCRSRGVDLRPFQQEIEAEIDALCSLRFSAEELAFLRTIYYLNPRFIDSLERLTLPRKAVEVFEEEGQLAIRVAGNWFQTILFEVPLLAIVNEVYFRTRSAEIPAGGQERLNAKLDRLAAVTTEPFKIIEFGTRRRYSRFWQQHVLQEFLERAPQFVAGTSNVALAKQFHLKVYGTMAHEYLQACQAMAPLHEFQKFALQAWADEYRGSLGIALSDVVGMDAFLRDFDRYFAMLFEGCRHDSGDPFVWGDKLIAHYQGMGIDPLTKAAVFSDGLTLDRCFELEAYFRNRIRVQFGVGTHLTNDWDEPALQIVMKMTRCQGQPVAKLSDSPGKTMCRSENFIRYLREVFSIPEAE